ncbi:MAG: NERD nuclease [Desulfuromonas sp.]|nr:MAG: NERD nuclease [Desulfuromonas sp.]
MLIKDADSKASDIAELEKLVAVASKGNKAQIEKELRFLKAGLKGEKEAAYFIDFALKDSQNTAVIHDLRLEANGRIAQIDHLLIHRTMTFFVLETKHFHSGLKIMDDGQFLQWNNFNKSFEGMSSPLAQNDRHVMVLKDVIKQVEWPTRLGMKLSPVYEPFVLVSSKARIDRPKKFDTSRVIKADELAKTIDNHLNSRGVLATLGAMSKVVSTDTLKEIAQSLAALHKPIKIDYRAKFGPDEHIAETCASYQTNQPAPTPQSFEIPLCRKCKSHNLTIQYGRYGYYFKCSDCTGNTPIKLDCGNPGHKERLRKEGLNFYRECAECATSTLFFTNPG